MKLSFIFEFQPVPFAFSFILESPFTVSPLKVWGGGIFSKKTLHGGDKFWISGPNLCGDCCTWGTNDHIMLSGGSNLNTKSENLSKSWWNIHLKKKP